MLAILYLIAAIWIGDVICRRFFSYGSFLHRAAAAVLVGLILSTWVTYLGVAAYPRSPIPLLGGDLLFLAFLAAVWKLWRREPATYLPRPPGRARWDLLMLAIWGAFTTWLMYATLGYKNGILRMGQTQWSDFGSTLAIVQSFAIGHNFPPEYPHFAGPPLSYHFLFLFQAGNIEWLGLRLHHAVNVLSILTFVSMVVLIMTLAERLCRSRAVGRVAACLFFFHSALSYVPFLASKPTLTEAFRSAIHRVGWIESIYSYRGELWGIWSLNIFANQRHLASSIGLLLLVLIFLVECYEWRLSWPKRKKVAPSNAETVPNGEALAPTEQTAPTLESPTSPETASVSVAPAVAYESSIATPVASEMSPAVEPPLPDAAPAPEPVAAEPVPAPVFVPTEPEPEPAPAPVPGGTRLQLFASFCFAGFVLGMLPLWNGAVFISACVVLAGLFVLLPLRGYMIGLGAFAGAFGIPQILLWRAGGGSAGAHDYPRFYFGYVIENPSIQQVFKYFCFTFGFKWLLIFAAFVLLQRIGRSLMAAAFGLVALAFGVAFSIELAANHKFLEIWIVLINIGVAYVLVRMTRLGLFGWLSAILLTVSITLCGVLDIFPFVNDTTVDLAMEHDQLLDWVLNKTNPRDVFLTDTVVSHPILMAGRKIFRGHDYYAWGAGYNTAERAVIYNQLYSERDPTTLVRLMNENHIRYVCFDDTFARGPIAQNEWLVKGYFRLAFEDTEGKHDHFRIYAVPTLEEWSQRGGVPLRPVVAPSPTPVTPAPPPERLGRPLGLAVGTDGTLYVAESDHNAVQKVTAGGQFIGGLGLADYKVPNGIAATRDGQLLVADTWNQRVRRVLPDGTGIGDLPVPASGFYGPRDVTVAPTGDIFVANAGRSEVVHYGANGLVLHTWGTKGAGDSQFNEPLGVAASDTEVFVADYLNGRIQVFTFDGKLRRKFDVPEWKGKQAWYRPAVTFTRGHLLVTDPAGNTVAVFSAKGEREGTVQSPDFHEPSGLAAGSDGTVYVTNAADGTLLAIALDPKGHSGSVRRFAPAH